MIRLVFVAPAYYAAFMRRRGGQRALVADVATRAERMGAGRVRLVLQDPTDEARFTVLAERVPTGRDSVLSLERSEDVDEPPALDPAEDREAQFWASELDPGLLPAEALAVGRALEGETNPRHLGGFGSTFAPHFPVAAVRLSSRADALDRAISPSSLRSAPAFGAHDVERLTFGAALRADALGIPRDVAAGEVRRVAIAEALGEPLEGVPDEIRRLAAACLTTDAHGLPAVDAARIAIASPPTGEEAYVSPGALAFAAGRAKPKATGVQRPPVIGSVLDELRAPARSPAERAVRMRARLAIEKAERALERARWVRWYLRGP